MKTKFGSFKLIFNVFQSDNLINISIDLADIDFTGFICKSIQTIYETQLDMNADTYNSQVYEMNNELKEYFKEIGLNLNKTKKYINLASKNSFYERIVLPKLSNAESQKSLNMELSKLYPEYQDKFVYSFISTSREQTITHRGYFISRRYYYDITQLFKELKTTFDLVLVPSNSLRRALLKIGVFNKKKKSLFIDVLSNNSLVVSYNGEIDHGFLIANCGYMNLVKNIAKYLKVDDAYVLEKLNSDYSFKEEMSDQVFFQLVTESYKDLILEIKRVVGQFYVHSLYDSIFFHLENVKGDFGKRIIEEVLRVEFSEINKSIRNVHLDHIMASGTLMKPADLDYKLPVKVKKYEEKLL